MSRPSSFQPWSVAVAIVLLAIACAPPAEQPKEEGDYPQRLITLAPSLTETAFALGLGERVVGVGDYDNYPPETAELPRLGGLINPNLERMVSLQPELAVVLPSQEDVARRLRQLEIPVLVLENETLEDVERAFQRLGEACGVEDTASQAIAEFRTALEPRAIAPGTRVMLSLSRPAGDFKMLRVAASGTFLDELLTRLGAVNIFADSPILYPQVGLEEVLARAPDVILEIYPEPVSPETTAALLTDWRKVAPQIPAVQRGRIHPLGGTHTVIPGPRLPQLYQAMAEALSPPQRESQARDGSQRRIPAAARPDRAEVQ